MRRLLVVLCLFTATACSARSSSRPAADAVVRAEALVAQGCYDCLLEARGIYATVQGESRRLALLRMLEVELLLVLREKELAIDARETMARARALSAQIADADLRRYLELVDAIAPDATGRRLLPPNALARAELEAAVAAVQAGPFSRLFGEYLTLSLQCGRVAQRPAALDASSAAPLLVYRLAICDDPIDVEPLRRVRAVVPRFVETSFFLGRAAMGSLFGSDGREAAALLEEAYMRFTSSAAIAFTLGTVYQATGDCRRAETFFSHALALGDDHADARLNRAVCRTYLANNDGAIADATMLIEAGSSNRAEAYYWRAWNRRHLKQLDSARSDIDNSRALLYNARVLTLAGMIEYDQQDYDKAREDLTRARDMDASECQARWYLGLLGFSTEEWAASAAGFADAADCYAMSITTTEAQRDAMVRRDDVAEEFRRQQLAGFDAAIAEDKTQKSAADLNAAINYARAGDVQQATTYMKRAAVDPERQAVVEDLRQVLGVPRW